MALFPAYSNANSDTSEQNPVGDKWLTNSSYIPPSKRIERENSKSNTSSDSESKPKSKRPHLKTIYRRKTRKSKEKESTDNGFYLDTVGDKQNLSMLKVMKNESNSRRVESSKPGSSKQMESTEPTLKTGSKIAKKRKKKKKEKSKKDRYYCGELEKFIESTDNNVTLLDTEEFLKRTEEFNKALRNDPQDVKRWLEYIKLQDRGEGTMRGIGEKKLSIIDRALSENSTSEALLSEKFNIIDKIWPYDKVVSEARLLVNKDPNVMLGWFWLIKCNQFNLSKMTVPSVLSMYSSALEGLHRMQKNANNMLDMLLQCGLFLRHAGLWEQLWTLLELYLELNLTLPGSLAFKIELNTPEDKLREIEDTIITCGLPLGALWLRIEHLREGVHFMPVESGEDPQRIVFAEDVSNLLYPVKRVKTVRMVAVILTILKVPPLPLTDCFSGFVGLKRIPWAFESTEYLLTACHGSGIVPIDINYIAVSKELLVGPQYLVDKLGENEFFELLNFVFESCEKYMETEKISVLVWHMRWWKFIVKVQGKDDKGCRAKAKKLLKQRRDSISLYVEYALLEKELGNIESTVKVLETAISLRDCPLNVVGEKHDIAYLYKTLVEVLLSQDFSENRKKVLELLIGLVLGMPIKDVVVNDETILKAKEKYKHLTCEFLQDFNAEQEISLSDVLLPHFVVSWIACHAWFFYLIENFWESMATVETAIKELKNVNTVNVNLGRCILENFYEVLINLAHHFCLNNPGHYNVLSEILERALNLFPDNVYFSHVTSVCKMNCSSWKTFKCPNDSTLASLFMIFANHAKLMKLEAENTVSKESSHQRMLNLLQNLSSNSSMEVCPLVWRLLLQCVTSRNPDEIKKTFYQAVEKCPWVKAIYYGAAQILPEELPQIQDLLVEKEVRLHITPEELEILRQGD